MPTSDHRFGPFDDNRWNRLDQLLADILSRAPDERPQRFRELAECHPDLAGDLETLLRNAADEHRLDDILQHALVHLAESDHESRQRRLGPWRLLSLIGHGGMAQVFLAERADGVYQQQVAIKLLWPGLASQREYERFHRERQLLAAMDDHRIARLVDGGITDDGRPWLAMEYVRGSAIDCYCERHGLGSADRLALFQEVTGAVASAHRRLAVHGDLKPRNVLVTDEGRVKLLDFGIGRLIDAAAEEDGRPALTPHYASPEQRRHERITTASDVYQLGCLLWELLTGVSPRDQALDNPGRHHSHELSADLCAIISRATAKAPEDRYGSVDALENDVRATVEGRPVHALGGGWAYRARCFVSRNRVAVAAAFLAMTVLTFAGGLYIEQTWRVAAEAEVNRAALAFVEDMLHTGDPYAGNGASIMPAEVLEEAARRAADELSEQPRVQARIFNVLGRIHRSRGESDLAMDHLHSAQAIAQAHNLHEELGRSRVGMAMVGIWSGDYQSAQDTLESVLGERQSDTAWSTDPLTTRIRLFLADLLHSRGDYVQAELLARETLVAGHHPAWSNRVLGMTLRDAGRFDEAERHLREAIALDRKRLGSSHSDVAIGLEHYGQLLLHTGRIQDARDSLDEAYRIRKALVGPDWNGLIWTRHWLGLCALAEGNLTRARTLLETTVSDYLHSFSESSHLLAFARSDLGWIALAQGELRLAEQLFQDATHRLETVQSGDHPRIAEPLLGLAITALAEDKPTIAQSHAARALKIRRQLFDQIEPDHPWMVSACTILRLAGGDCPETSTTLTPQALDHIKMGLATCNGSGVVCPAAERLGRDTRTP